ncbi:hypothetical protein LCGC14_1848780 [marine sediment metagenome]|uniref:Uncharacterized protein n=1 Tax=marine sediment metagenome TaxID=412755 RepID=A0A0F9GB72_9ZZZZ
MMKAYFRPDASVVVKFEEGDSIPAGVGIIVDLNGLVKRPDYTHMVPVKTTTLLRAMSGIVEPSQKTGKAS